MVNIENVDLCSQFCLLTCLKVYQSRTGSIRLELLSIRPHHQLRPAAIDFLIVILVGELCPSSGFLGCVRVNFSYDFKALNSFGRLQYYVTEHNILYSCFAFFLGRFQSRVGSVLQFRYCVSQNLSVGYVRSEVLCVRKNIVGCHALGR